MTEDVWSTPQEEGGGSKEMLSGSDLPDAGALVSALIEDLKANLMPYIITGIGTFAAVFAMVLALFALIGICLLPGLLMDNETVLAVGGLISALVYLVVLFALIFIWSPLMIASNIRAANAQLAGERPMSLLSGISNAPTSKTISIALFYVLLIMASTVGYLFFIFPGLFIMQCGYMTLAILSLEEETTMSDAIGRTMDHVKENVGWYAIITVLAYVIAVVAQITIIGLLFILPLTMAFATLSYRAAHGLPLRVEPDA